MTYPAELEEKHTWRGIAMYPLLCLVNRMQRTVERAIFRRRFLDQSSSLCVFLESILPCRPPILFQHHRSWRDELAYLVRSTSVTGNSSGAHY